MRLPKEWEAFLKQEMELPQFYRELETFVSDFHLIIPGKNLMFKAFRMLKPQQVKCVVWGEDPYPRLTSANGIAFWDAEIESWQDQTNGKALINIFKALLVARGLAVYGTPVGQCREIALSSGFKSPAALFEHWLKQGILPINTAMTFSSFADKRRHFNFWRPFHQALIKTLNRRQPSPLYILWGRKAWKWEREILKSSDGGGRIIKQSHPTFIHQFLDKSRPRWSPFIEIEKQSGFNWS